MRFSDSVRLRLLTRQKSAANSSSLRPQAPLRSLPANGSSVTRLMYFSRLTDSRKRSKHALKIARNTQLHGCVAPWRPIRNPKPRQMLHAGAANASVSERVHNIIVLFILLETRHNNRVRLADVLSSLTALASHVNPQGSLELGKNSFFD